jgi:hypothetical protein
MQVAVRAVARPSRFMALKPTVRSFTALAFKRFSAVECLGQSQGMCHCPCSCSKFFQSSRLTF